MSELYYDNDVYDILINVTEPSLSERVQVIESSGGFDCDTARNFNDEHESRLHRMLWCAMLYRNEQKSLELFNPGFHREKTAPEYIFQINTGDACEPSWKCFEVYAKD